MTTQDELDARYGRTASAARRAVLAIVIAVAALVVGAFAWMTVASTMDDVSVDTTGFSVDGERTLTLAFQVTAPVGRSVACALEAQDVEHGVVGWRIVQFPASDLHARAFREAIPTTAEATTGLVNSCWVT